MIGFLRLIGVWNAGIWLGGTIFFPIVVAPALHSAEMKALLNVRNFPYFSPAIEHIALSFYFQFSIACALVALLHLTLESIHLGRAARRYSFGLLGAFLLLALIGGNWLQPRLKTLHATRYSATATPAQREAAAKSYRSWHAALVFVEWIFVGGLWFHFWQIALPPSTPRFVPSVKFRG